MAKLIIPASKIAQPPDSTADDTLEKIIENSKRLGVSANGLNTKGAKLTHQIDRINRVLSMLNLGVEAWVQTEGGWEDDQSGDYERHYVGYASVRNEWCLAIRQTRGNEHSGDEHSNCRWAFNEAPYPMRVQAIELLAKLLGRLTKKVDAVSEKLDERIGRATEFADAIITGLKGK